MRRFLEIDELRDVGARDEGVARARKNDRLHRGVRVGVAADRRDTVVHREGHGVTGGGTIDADPE